MVTAPYLGTVLVATSYRVLSDDSVRGGVRVRVRVTVMVRVSVRVRVRVRVVSDDSDPEPSPTPPICWSGGVGECAFPMAQWMTLEQSIRSINR